MSIVNTVNAASDSRPPSKLFAFSGVDMAHGGLDILRRAINDGCLILPLDVEAIGVARREGTRFTTVDEWLSDGEREEAHRLAYNAELGWFDGCRAAFTSDGVCWPEFDHHSMSYFWQEVFLAGAIAARCCQTGIKELRFRKVRPRKAGLNYEPSRAYGNYWESAFPALSYACNLSVAKQVRWQVARAIGLVGSGLGRFCGHPAEPGCNSEEAVQRSGVAPDEGMVVFAVNWAELQRFEEVIRQVSLAFPQRVMVRLHINDPDNAARFVCKFPVPVYPGPSPASISPEVGEGFVRGLDQVTALAQGAPWERALQCLRFHFEYYCRERWPQLHGQCEAWKRLWADYRPAAVIVSSLLDAESQLPAQAARALGIPSLSIPHGAGVVRAWEAIAAERVLYDVKIHRVVYSKSGIPAERLFPCRDLLVQDEYSVGHHLWNTSMEMKRVLALTDPISPMGCLSGWVGHAAQIRDLRALTDRPEDLTDRLDVRFKAHPAWPDTDLFEAAGVDVRTALFPASTRLGPLLAAADLVVAVNYCGGALVHALRAAKPVLLFWTDPLLSGKHDFWHPEVYASCGPVARSVDELWNLLRRFVNEPAVAEQMRAQAEAFRREFLDDSGYPSLSEILRSIMPGRASEFPIDAGIPGGYGRP